MQRRTAIRNLLIISGGIAILPSCFGGKGKSSGGLKHLVVSREQETLLEAIAETILPATNTPGARELGLHLFVLKMVDDCHETKDQQAFMKGLEQLSAAAEKQYGTSFTNSTRENREALLVGIEKDQQAAAEMGVFYRIMKDRTIQGYLNSKYVMTHLDVYELVPGRYDGYFPVKAS
ncbi:gluconate 2-dehydrogenase subunit 3 family protein [Chitinophaga sp. MM2321]|uniref:gluconate 2-dehydrogenase subunit 3 family protein n=1 Tax=Chitinophaga sp. MM2321 TaxID=3137178 RepID=UPI0032D598EC